MNSKQPVQTMVRLPRAELHSWGVDYIRVTTKIDAGKKDILINWAKRRAQLERLGDRLKKGGLQGFKGESVGPLFYGRKDDIFMLQASGGLADEMFPHLAWDHLNCTRLDLQVTLQFPDDNPNLEAYIGAARAKPFLDTGKEPDPKQKLDHTYVSGDTLYIGKRVSPRFGRIYDKARESGDERYARCHRFEIELKDMMARNAVAYLRQCESLDRGVAALVRGQFADWGIELELPVQGQRLAGSIGRREFDSERALRWLETQVAPTVDRLLATVDRESIIEALRLSESPRRPLPAITEQWLAATGQDGVGEFGAGQDGAGLARRW